MAPAARLLRLPVALLVAWLVAACTGGSTTDPDPNAVASVVVSANGATTIPIGGTVQLQAQARNATGQPVTGVPVTWTSQNPTVAQVNSTGLVSGLTVGASAVSASAGGRSGQVTVTVEDLSPPAAPSNLQATVVSNTRIDLTWIDNSTNEQSFRVEREGGAGSLLALGNVNSPGLFPVFAEVATLPAGTTAFSDPALLPATTYRHRVRACNANGCSAFTPTVESTTFTTLVITTDQLPAGTVGVAYQATLAATGGTGAPVWSLASGTLPPGATLSSAGVLSGTPTQAGSFGFTVRATGAGQQVDRPLGIQVNAQIVPPAVTTTFLPDGTVGVAYGTTLQATGGDGTYTWALTAGSLPAGVTLSTAGVISGTPTVAGAFPVTVQVTSAALSGTADLTLTIVFPPVVITTTSLPDGLLGTAYNQQLVATGGDGTSYAWSIASGSLPDGIMLAAGTGVLSGTPTVVGDFAFTVAVASGGQTDTQALTLRIVAPAVVVTTTSLPDGTVGVAYAQNLTATGGDGVSYTWTIVAGSLPGGLTLDGSTGVISGTPSAAGSFPFTVRASSAGQSGDQALSITINAAPPPLQITTTSLPDGTTGVAYSQALAHTGGDGSAPAWSVIAGALPAGLSLASATGVISGTPTTAGTANFTVRVAVGAQTADQPLAITVTGVSPVTIENWYLRVGIIGTAYPAGVGVVVSGGDGANFAYEVVAGALPPGIALGAANGLFSGTPTTSGTFFFEVKVTSAGQETSRVFALSVSTRPIGGYNIAIVNASGLMPSATNRAALDGAVAKWESAITTDLVPLTMPTPTGLDPSFCQGHASKVRGGEVIEDLLVFLDIDAIDGVGGTVARAGPCGYVTPDDLIWMGSVVFDEADLAVLDSDRIQSTILHEIGHVVGIGTLWTALGNALLDDEGGPDPQYTGAAGMAAYATLGGVGTVPVENTGGTGTRDGHWRESVFDTEVMTGFLEAMGVTMPLSIVSVRSLEDLGWAVDVSAADAYVLPAPGFRAAAGGSRVPLGNDAVIERLYRIRADGRVELLRSPR